MAGVMVNPATEDSRRILLKAKENWLNKHEVVSLLKNHQSREWISIPKDLPRKPPSGTLILFHHSDSGRLRTRNDGYNWRKKERGNRGVNESHVTLKVKDSSSAHIYLVEGYYSRGEDNPNFRRRIYCMKQGDSSTVVLLHYRELPVTGPVVDADGVRISGNNAGGEESVVDADNVHQAGNNARGKNPVEDVDDVHITGNNAGGEESVVDVDGVHQAGNNARGRNPVEDGDDVHTTGNNAGGEEHVVDADGVHQAGNNTRGKEPVLDVVGVLEAGNNAGGNASFSSETFNDAQCELILTDMLLEDTSSYWTEDTFYAESGYMFDIEALPGENIPFSLVENTMQDILDKEDNIAIGPLPDEDVSGILVENTEKNVNIDPMESLTSGFKNFSISNFTPNPISSGVENEMQFFGEYSGNVGEELSAVFDGQGVAAK